MPPVKNWTGAPSVSASPDPKAKPTEGSAMPRSQNRWQGAYSQSPSPNPTEKPAGSAKIPGSK